MMMAVGIWVRVLTRSDMLCGASRRITGLMAVVWLAMLPVCLAADPLMMQENLAQQLSNLQRRVINGRVLFTTFDPTRSSSSTAGSGERRERLLLSYVEGQVSLTYESTTPQLCAFRSKSPTATS